MPALDLPRGNAGPKPKVTLPKSATALQAFHNSEAASQKPSVQKANYQLSQKALTPPIMGRPHGSGTFSKPGKAFKQPASAYKNPPAPKTSKPKNVIGSGAHLAAIMSPYAAATQKPVTSVMGTLFNQIYHMPGDTLKGVMELGVPAASGIGQLMAGDTPGAVKNFKQVGSTAVAGIKADPVLQAIEHGDPSYLAKDPLGTLMDASMLYSGIGKAAGLATGAGTEARAAHELVPGIPGTQVLRQPSGNAFTRAAQRYADERGGAARVLPPGLQPAAVGHQLRKMVAQWYGPEKSQIASELHATDKVLKKAAPKDETVANVVPYFAAFGTSPETLYRARDFLNQAKAEGRLSGKAGEVHLDNVEAAIAKHEAGKFDWSAADRATTAYGGNQDKLEAAKSIFGLHETPEMERAALKQYALQNMDNTRVLSRAVSHPEDVIARSTAQAQLRQADKEFKQAQLNHVKNLGDTRATGLRNIRAVTAKYSAARAAEAQARAAIMKIDKTALDGVEGPINSQGIRLAPVDANAREEINAKIPAAHWLRLDETMRAADDAAKNLHDARISAPKLLADTRQQGKARIAATRENLKDARASFAMAKNTPLRKMRGLVTEDPNALPIQAGSLKGQRLRPMTDAEIRNHMEERGLTNSYVNMTNPDRKQALTFNDLRANRAARSGATGKPYTGRAAQTGDWAAGYKAMHRSQLQDVMNVGAARMERNFINRFGMKDPNGNYFTEEGAREAAAAYEREHHIPMEVVQDVSAKNVPSIGDAYGQEHYVLIAKDQWDELQRHIKLERPTGVARFGLRFNRAFRNTTLPMSSKLWVMHPVENVTRAGMIGATPMSYGLERAVLGDMRASGLDEAAARLEDIATPGGLGGQQNRLNLEDMSRATPEERNIIRERAGQVARAWDDTARTIIRGQRAIEVATQRAALGVHMQRTLRSWGVSVTQTNFAVSKYVHRLAEAYADPAMAEDAAHFLHNSMGQYNNFTSHMRWFITRVSPFLPWYLNAAKLVMIGLPRDHPFISVLLHDVRQATAAQWDAQHQGLPPDMQTAVKTGDNRWTDFARFLPTGLTGTPLAEAEALIAPQYAGAVHAAVGQDPFGGEYKGPNTPFGKSAYKFGDPGTLPRIFEQLGESSLGPIPDLAKAIENRRGETMYNTSMPLLGQVDFKPGTEDSHLRGLPAGFARIFNPFRSTIFGGGSSFPTSLGAAGGLNLSKTSAPSLKGAGGLNLSGAK